MLPLCRPAISPFILSKTSKLPSSAAHEGAALCLMSLLFCCSDLPPPKPHSSAVIHGSCDNGEALWGKTSGARGSKGLKPHAATKLTSAAFSAPFQARAILLCNYDRQFSLKQPNPNECTMYILLRHFKEKYLFDALFHINKKRQLWSVVLF